LKSSLSIFSFTYSRRFITPSEVKLDGSSAKNCRSEVCNLRKAKICSADREELELILEMRVIVLELGLRGLITDLLALLLAQDLNLMNASFSTPPYFGILSFYFYGQEIP
jgi:hypothetical protein